MAAADKPHVVCIAYPAQSHMKAMLKLAKLLHHKGCHITFVNTEYIHRRLLNARGPNALDGLPDFQFETIPDGLPPPDANATFVSLVGNLNDSASSSDTPPVSCIVSDGFMSFSITAAEELGIPVITFFTLSACGFMGFCQLHVLLEKGLIPMKDASCLTNGYLDTVIDWIPGMKDIRLKDLPSVLRTMDPNDMGIKYCIEIIERSSKASAIILHTFDALEQDIVNALKSMFPSFYTIGPLQLLLNQISEEDKSESVGYNIWKEESECLQWLNDKEPGSVIYINFGSLMVMTQKQLEELGWGLANSKHNFLWIIRPDLVTGDSGWEILPPELVEETKERGLIASWCPQEEVLNHQSVGGFVTHCGWNSTMESLSAGVPMICWPFLWDQLTNCRYTCTEWKAGMEIDDNDVKRDEIEKLVRELMEGEKGKKMKDKALEWKKFAEKATGPDGSSTLNLNNLVNQLLLL